MSSALDDEARLRAIDRSNMREVLARLPDLCEDSLRLSRGIEVPDQVKVNSKLTVRYRFPEKVIVAGMGGSAIGGDLLKDWLRDRCLTPIEVSREYHLPKHAGPGTLIMAVSYSGNTEETLSSFVEAVECGCMTFSVSSGGLLEEFNNTLGLPHLRIPGGYAPRSAVPYLFFPIATMLHKLGAVECFDDEVAEAVKVLRSLRAEIGPTVPIEKNSSKRLAVGLRGLIPMVCGYGHFESVATRVKTQFNENSKTPAKAENFPELNHNETLGWSGLRELTKNFGVVMIRSRGEPPEMKARIEVTKDLVFDKGAGCVFEIESRGAGRLAQMLSAMYVGDFASFYLGLLYGIDPTPVPIIDELKRRLDARLGKAVELKRRVGELKAA